MPIKKNETTPKTKQKRVLGRKEKIILTGAIVLLVIAIVCVSIFAVYPKIAGRPDWQIMGALNFNDSNWIEDMVYNRIKPVGKVLDITSSFVYSKDTAYITAQYASETTVEEAKKVFLKQLPGSVDKEANEISRMDISGNLNGEAYDIVNYDADMFAAYDTKITIAKDKAQAIKEKLIREYPTDICNKVPELAEIMKSEKLGGYVMYNDDQLSNSSYPGAPIFSEAYRYKGSKDELIKIEKALKDKFTDSIFFEDDPTVYFKDQGYIFSLNCSESDQNILAVITVQKIPDSVMATAKAAAAASPSAAATK
jgi:hypothetical protein